MSKYDRDYRDNKRTRGRSSSREKRRGTNMGRRQYRDSPRNFSPPRRYRFGGNRNRSRSRSRSRSRDRYRDRYDSFSRRRYNDSPRDRPRFRRGSDRRRSRSRSRTHRRGNRDDRRERNQRGNRRKRDNTRQGRRKKQNDRGEFMKKEPIKELFIQALKAICDDEKADKRFPFNVSIVNDMMVKLNSNYSIFKSDFKKFSVLVKELMDTGDFISESKKQSIYLTDSKFAPDRMRVPLTEEEMAQIRAKHSNRRKDRSDKKKKKTENKNSEEKKTGKDSEKVESCGEKETKEFSDRRRDRSESMSCEN